MNVKMQTELHQSERQCFKRCRKKWQFRYVTGLLPKKRQPALWLGTGIHAGLEGYYQSKGSHVDGAEAMVAAWSAFVSEEHRRTEFDIQDTETQDRLAADINLGADMLNRYLEWALTVDKGIHWLATELKIHALHPRVQDLLLTGRVDGIVRGPDGRVWIWEHKTIKEIDPEARHLELDEQSTMYLWIVQQLIDEGELAPAIKPGTKLAGVWYNFLAKKKAVPPTFNKNGAPSKVIGNILYEDYYRAIVDYANTTGKDENELIEEYADKLIQLREKIWFHRVQIARSAHELISFEHEIEAEYDDMSWAATHSNHCYRNQLMGCRFDCPYMELCINDAKGIDTEMIIAENYTPAFEGEDVEDW